jgi:hypothetical protein
MDPMALEVASEDDAVLLLGEKWCAVLFILLFFTCFLGHCARSIEFPKTFLLGAAAFGVGER